MTRTFTVVSLFCGAGGLDIGFRDFGFDLVYACDDDPAAVDCYARNVDARVYRRDVQGPQFRAEIAEIGKCDVVVGGFPCQGFSKAGPKRADDLRNPLYMEMRRAIEQLEPTLFIAENVDGLSQNFSGAYLDRILEDFQTIGYSVQHRLLDAVCFGVAQYRRRIFFVGVRDGASESFSWPAPTHAAETRNGEFKVTYGPTLWDNSPSVLHKPLSISDAIGDLVDLHDKVPDHCIVRGWPSAYDKIFPHIKQGQKLCNVRHATTSVYTWNIPIVFGAVTPREVTVLETISKHRRHKQYGDIPNGNPLSVAEIERLSGLEDIRSEIQALLKKNYVKEIAGKYDLKGAMFCSGIFKRPKWDEPAPTVLTNFYNPRYFLHPLQDRPFSLRECARMQGFEDDFIFLSSVVDLQAGYRLVGNAVPPPLSKLFAASAKQLLIASCSTKELVDEVA